ncbi:MAG: condensation domain-containing protein, partial [Rhodobacteraceae bacterium]|nr:condensation domain-containing protein [Paracoccaceae bacterium]
MVRQFSATPFQLQSDLPLRVAVIRFAPQRAKLSLVFHHIAFDGWSYQLFLSELAMEMAGQTPPAPAFQIADIARQQGESPVEAAKLDYWQSRLAGVEPLNGLPPDMPRMGGAGYVPAALQTCLDQATTRALAAAAQQAEVTMFEYLQACFGAVIACWSGRDHAIIGTPVAGRSHPASDRMIGLFVNTLPIRINMPSGQAFSQILRQSAQQFRGDLAHQEVSFDAIIAGVITTRDPSYPPLVQIFLAVNEAEEDRLEMPGVRATAHLAPRSSVNFELELHVTLSAAGAELDWHFAQNLFDEATIRTLAESFDVLVRDTLGRPDCPVDRLALVSDNGLAALARRAASTPAPAFRDFCDRFAARVMAAPDRVACCDQDHHWTYADLDARSRRVAAALQGAGVRPGDLVGLAADRGREDIVGMRVGCLPPGTQLAVELEAGLFDLGAGKGGVDPVQLFGGLAA